MGLLLLLLLGAPLPAGLWSVGSDGKSCVQLEEALAAELATWSEDPESSVPDEGVFGRVNPENARQLVLLFKSKKVCERIVWAVGQEARDNLPSRTLDAKDVRAQVERLVSTDAGLKKSWPGLSGKQQKAVHAEASALFAGDANRVRARKRIAGILRKKKKKPIEELQLTLWLELYAVVFGEAYADEAATDQ